MGTTPLLLEIEALRRGWGWLLALGVAMINLGIASLFPSPP
jgi:uncharacterized membrane protein HdeD (DUF308 family)